MERSSSATWNMLSRNSLSGFILRNFRNVYPKLSWSREVKRSTSLNQRQENRFDMGVWARTMKEPSGTSVIQEHWDQSGIQRGGMKEKKLWFYFLLTHSSEGGCFCRNRQTLLAHQTGRTRTAHQWRCGCTYSGVCFGAPPPKRNGDRNEPRWHIPISSSTGNIPESEEDPHPDAFCCRSKSSSCQDQRMLHMIGKVEGIKKKLMCVCNDR